jgi:Flp pilus assembly protein TadG
MIIRNRAAARRAAYVVEFAVVLPIVVLFLFGIFEYGRYISFMQVVENAAREGARVAIAHTNDMTTADVVARVTERMGLVDRQVAGFQVDVQGIILRPQNAGEVAGQALTDWTEAATTDGISVTVTGDYKPILPSLVRMPATIPVNVRVVMYSEGN